MQLNLSAIPSASEVTTIWRFINYYIIIIIIIFGGTGVDFSALYM